MDGYPRSEADIKIFLRSRNNSSQESQEECFFNAVKKYMNKPEQVDSEILQRLDFILITTQLTKTTEIMDILLKLSYKYLSMISLQRPIAKTLTFFCQLNPLVFFEVTVKRNIITAFMNGIIYHNYDEMLVVYFCKIIEIMKVKSQDVMPEFRRLLEMFNHVLSCSTVYNDIMDLILSAITWVCHDSPIEHAQQIKFGNFGIIEKLLILINNGLIGHEGIKIALGTIGNVIMDIPANCKKLIDNNIMSGFFNYLTLYRTQPDIYRCVLRILNYISQVEELHPNMMTVEFLFVCVHYMEINEFDISFYASGIVAHLCASSSWNLTDFPIEEALSHLADTMKLWNFKIDNFPKYSIKPLLKLAQAKHTTACVFYAVWTLENLTSQYPEEYCCTLIDEGGLDILVELLDEDYPAFILNDQPGKIGSVAQSVIHRCMNFKRTPKEETQE